MLRATTTQRAPLGDAVCEREREKARENGRVTPNQRAQLHSEKLLQLPSQMLLHRNNVVGEFFENKYNFL